MTGHIYQDVILEQHAFVSGCQGVEFLFMDDNARPHRANIVDECLQSEDISRMIGQYTHRTLNPIDMCGICLADELARCRQPPPTCLP
ncbi:DDE_3 domain-containing protein [Trichonephila clavipes]|nr:DDE_3 domain-containing protein [Trichonephila clavipes]